MLSHEEIIDIQKKLEEHESRISKLESFFQTKPEAVKKVVSIKEFILSKGPKDDLQKTLTIGYYLEKFVGYSTFNIKDLENGFRSAKETVPRNINDCVYKNIKKGGYLMEAEEKKDRKKAWTLTTSGEKYIENNFKDKE